MKSLSTELIEHPQRHHTCQLWLNASRHLPSLSGQSSRWIDTGRSLWFFGKIAQRTSSVIFEACSCTDSVEITFTANTTAINGYKQPNRLLE
jgi:hypothetical protein